MRLTKAVCQQFSTIRKISAIATVNERQLSLPDSLVGCPVVPNKPTTVNSWLN